MTFARSARNPSLRNCGVNARVVQVEIGNENVQECFCSMYSMLDVLDVLWCGVSPPVRGLVVCAFCSPHVLASEFCQKGHITNHSCRQYNVYKAVCRRI